MTFSVFVFRGAILVMCIGWTAFGALVSHLWHVRRKDWE